MTNVEVTTQSSTVTVSPQSSPVTASETSPSVTIADDGVTIVSVVEQTPVVTVDDGSVVVQVNQDAVSVVSVGIQGPPGVGGSVASLNDVGDVTVSSALDGDLLEYDGVADVWRNKKGDKSPSFTYSAGRLTRIDYSSGHYKLFTYTGDALTRVRYFLAGRTVTKDFTYNPDGTLASVSQTETYN